MRDEGENSTVTCINHHFLPRSHCGTILDEKIYWRIRLVSRYQFLHPDNLVSYLPRVTVGQSASQLVSQSAGITM